MLMQIFIQAEDCVSNTNSLAKMKPNRIKRYSPKRDCAMPQSLILIFLAAILPLAVCADPSTPEDLAKSYIAASQAHDGAAIRKLVHPKFLQALNANQKKMLDMWIQQSMDDAGQWKLHTEIVCTVMMPASLAELSKYWVLLVPPDVQVDMNTFRDIGNNSREGVGGSTQWAAKLDGKYYFILPFPKKQ